MKKIICALPLLFLNVVHAQTITGTVVYITDGDTVKIKDAFNKIHKIRLGGIDAPEKRQTFGKKSSQVLAECALNKPATVTWNKLDKYKRVVGVVYVDDTDCNLNQIHKGVAYHYKKYQYEQTTKNRLTYAQAERVAKKNSVGVWSRGDLLKPWDYRKLKRQKRNTVKYSHFDSPKYNSSNMPSGQGLVKLSRNKICHAQGTKYFNRVKRFKPFTSLQECLRYGRLPRG